MAIDGGTPVRAKLLPYGRQSIDEEDIAAVADVLRSDWLTTGPKVAEFERAVAAVAGTKEPVAVSNGTAALHAAMYALGIGPGDEVIVPTITFAASANCVAFLGGTPVFADVDPDTLLDRSRAGRGQDHRQDQGRDRRRLRRPALRLRPLAGRSPTNTAWRWSTTPAMPSAAATRAGRSVRWPSSTRSASIR